MISIAKYLDLELKSDMRHEFHDGEVFAMAGGTKNHGILGTNILTEVNIQVRNKGCITFNGDVKIRIQPSNRFLYPEASIVCGKLETSEEDEEAIRNPVLIVEVLSDSSEAYDRGAKFRLYQQLPSFKEYLLIDQHKSVISIFFRKEENIWEMREVIGLEQVIHLQSLDIEVAMQDLYRNTLELKSPY
ncbi:MAG: Uma2 family endonuclease [Bacteroidota bacterium]